MLLLLEEIHRPLEQKCRSSIRRQNEDPPCAGVVVFPPPRDAAHADPPIGRGWRCGGMRCGCCRGRRAPCRRLRNDHRRHRRRRRAPLRCCRRFGRGSSVRSRLQFERWARIKARVAIVRRGAPIAWPLTRPLVVIERRSPRYVIPPPAVPVEREGVIVRPRPLPLIWDRHVIKSPAVRVVSKRIVIPRRRRGIANIRRLLVLRMNRADLPLRRSGENDTDRHRDENRTKPVVPHASTANLIVRRRAGRGIQ